MKKTRKMYEMPEQPKQPQNRSTIFTSEKNLLKQSKGLDFAQKRHLEEMRARNAITYHFDAAKDRSLYVTVNPRGNLNKFDDLVGKNSQQQRTTIFSNPVFLSQNKNFPQTQRKRLFLGDFKCQGNSVKTTLNPEEKSSRPQSQKINRMFIERMAEAAKQPKVSQHKNMCSQNNHLFQMLISPDQQFTNEKFKNEPKVNRKGRGTSQNASMVSSEITGYPGFRRSGSVVALTRTTEYHSNLTRGNMDHHQRGSIVSLGQYAKMARTASTGNLSSANLTSRVTIATKNSLKK